MRYTNNTGLSLFAQVFLATDYYDTDEAGLSVTTLLKPTRQVILSRRVPEEACIADVVDQIANRVGSAVHDGFERAWKHVKLQEVLVTLGVPERAAKKVTVNPTPEQLAAGGIIPVYTEVRSSKIINGVKVSGKFDFIGEGTVEDLKNTSVWKFMNTDGEDYVWQGSMYRLLNPEKVTKDHLNITFNFTDWQAYMVSQKPGIYPPRRMLTKRFKLRSIEETQAWAESRVNLLLKYHNSPDEEIPLCTDQELWRSDTQYRYYKKAADAHIPNKKSTKNFEDKAAAYQRLAEDGNTGTVIVREGEVKACKYCSAFAICKQKDALIASGDLVLSQS